MAPSGSSPEAASQQMRPAHQARNETVAWSEEGTEASSGEGEYVEASTSLSDLIYALAAFALEHWRLYLVAAFVGVLVPFVVLTVKGPSYTATAQFVPQGSDQPDLGGLQGLAGQLGVSLRSGSSAPPELYAALASSSMILSPIAADTFTIVRNGSRVRGTLAELFKFKGESPTRQRELVLKYLRGQMDASVNRRTSAIGLRVTTPWRNVSLRVASQILEQLNEFNLRQRQSTARAEREFAEGRLNEQSVLLRLAEDALRDFATRNRSAGSPTLQLEMERLQRVVSQRQQVLTALEQSYESARMREVRDTPVITILQAPEALSIPDPRGRIKWGIVGSILAMLCASVFVKARQMIASSRTAPTPEARRFRAALAAARRSALGPFARRTGA